MESFSSALKRNIRLAPWSKSQPMKKTWQEVRSGKVARPPQQKKKVSTVQERRYAERMSYGGGYPLGYKGRNPKRKKIPFNQWLKAVEKEFDLADVHPKWSGFTAKKFYKVYSPKKAAEKLILESKRRKNPALKFKDLKNNDAFIFESEKTMPHSGMALGPWIKFDKRTYYKDKTLSPGQIRHLIKIGSINVKVIKTGERIFDNRRRKNPKRRKNPIAIYNPPGKQKLLYGRAYIPVIRGIKTNGKYKGEKYEHKFSKNEVAIYGNSDGSLMVKSNNNLRLWNYDKDI